MKRRRPPFERDRSEATPLARRASFYALLAGSELGTQEHLDAIFDRLAWVTRYSKGAVTLREALGLPEGTTMSAWTLRMYEHALERLLMREHEKPQRSDPTEDE